jgi:hypothetical protein
LTKLSLGSAKDVTDYGIEAAMKANGSRLQKLVLPFGSNLTGKSLVAISQYCSQLRVLANIPISIVSEELEKWLPKLTKLVVVSQCSSSQVAVAPSMYFLSRQNQDRIKSKCKRLKHFVTNI